MVSHKAVAMHFYAKSLVSLRQALLESMIIIVTKENVLTPSPTIHYMVIGIFRGRTIKYEYRLYAGDGSKEILAFVGWR